MILELLELINAGRHISNKGVRRVPSKIQEDWVRMEEINKREEQEHYPSNTINPGTVSVTCNSPVDVKVTKTNDSITYSFSFN